MNIAENIRKFREQNGMEQQDLAKLLNLSNKTISSWECGRTEPRMGMIEAMCKIFNCEKTELIDGVKSFNFENRILAYAEALKNLSPESQEKAKDFIDYLIKKEADTNARISK